MSKFCSEPADVLPGNLRVLRPQIFADIGRGFSDDEEVVLDCLLKNWVDIEFRSALACDGEHCGVNVLQNVAEPLVIPPHRRSCLGEHTFANTRFEPALGDKIYLALEQLR